MQKNSFHKKLETQINEVMITGSDHIKSKSDTLCESEKKYRTIIESIEDGYYEVDLHGNFTFFNDSMCKILGYSKEEIVGMNNKSYMDEQNVRKVFKAFNWVYKTGVACKAFDWELIKKDGSRCFIDTSITLITNSEDNPIGFHGIARDITECKQAEKVLQKSKLKLEAIFEANPNPVVVYDFEGYPQNLNQAFADLFGWTLDELIGRRIPFVPEDQKQKTADKINEIYSLGKPLKFRTKRLTKHGDKLSVIVTAATIKDFQGKSNGMVVNLINISEQRRLEVQLQQAQKMEALGTLAGGIAHDFNNILSGLFGFTQLAKAHLKNPDKAGKHIDGIINSAKKARDLVKQILTFSRKTNPEKEFLSLDFVVNETLEFLSLTLTSTIKIEKTMISKANVFANTSQMNQVVMNLGINACHAMGEAGGTLTVSLEEIQITDPRGISEFRMPLGRYAKLEVKDTGIGMNEEILKKIFEPYFTTKEIGKGTGLGMSVVFSIIEKHNGFIFIDSELGKGTHVRVYIPIKEKKNAR